jgi:hypothetical protein
MINEFNESCHLVRYRVRMIDPVGISHGAKLLIPTRGEGTEG